MADLKGTNVAAKLVPFTDNDNFATHEDTFGQGGYRSVLDIAERNAIPANRRKEGMLVYVMSDDETWQLKGGTYNTDWVRFGTGIPGNDTVTATDSTWSSSKISTELSKKANSTDLSTHTSNTTVHFQQSEISITTSQVSNFSTSVDSAITAKKNVANGIAGLGSDGKVAPEQLPQSVLGGLNYKGTWNANTNTPALTSSVGTEGDYYIVSIAGTTTIDSENDWNAKDIILFGGGKWRKVDNTDSVISVAGKKGIVSLSIADIADLQANLDSKANDSITVKTNTTQTISAEKTFSVGIKTDVVNESTAGAGVTIDGVALKDGNVNGIDIVTLDSKAHVHSNKTVLDQLGVADGKLTLNGSPVDTASSSGATIDDTSTATDKTWSANKINTSLTSKADSANVYDKTTVDIKLAGKSDTTHTHDVYPNAKAIVKAGTNITITADDTGKTLTINSTASGSGDMSKSTYDANSNGIVDRAEVADAVGWTGITDRLTVLTPVAMTGTKNGTNKVFTIDYDLASARIDYNGINYALSEIAAYDNSKTITFTDAPEADDDLYLYGVLSQYNTLVVASNSNSLSTAGGAWYSFDFNSTSVNIGNVQSGNTFIVPSTGKYKFELTFVTGANVNTLQLTLRNDSNTELLKNSYTGYKAGGVSNTYTLEATLTAGTKVSAWVFYNTSDGLSTGLYGRSGKIYKLVN